MPLELHRGFGGFRRVFVVIEKIVAISLGFLDSTQ